MSVWIDKIVEEIKIKKENQAMVNSLVESTIENIRKEIVDTINNVNINVYGDTILELHVENNNSLFIHSKNSEFVSTLLYLPDGFSILLILALNEEIKYSATLDKNKKISFVDDSGETIPSSTIARKLIESILRAEHNLDYSGI